MKPLTPKQQRFTDEYLIDLNATQAAIRAGYSEKTACQIGEQNLRKLDIAEEIEKRMQKRGEECALSQEWVLLRLKQNYEAAVAAKELNTVNRVLELIGKHLGMFKERFDVTDDLKISKIVREIVLVGRL
jgi:phage terminase small subunit